MHSKFWMVGSRGKVMKTGSSRERRYGGELYRYKGRQTTAFSA